MSASNTSGARDGATNDDAELAEIEARHAEDEADPFRSSAYVAHVHRGTLLRLLDEAAAREARLIAGLNKVIEIANGPGALDSRYRAIAENAKKVKP